MLEPRHSPFGGVPLPSSSKEARMNPFRLPRWRFMNCCGHAWGHADHPVDAGRRDFLKLAATGVAALAAGAAAGEASAQVRVFPPPPPALSPIEGLIHFHTHCAPHVF